MNERTAYACVVALLVGYVLGVPLAALIVWAVR